MVHPKILGELQGLYRNRHCAKREDEGFWREQVWSFVIWHFNKRPRRQKVSRLSTEASSRTIKLTNNPHQETLAALKQMEFDLPTLLSDINIQDYLVEIPITGDWVSYRYSPSPFTASKKEGRYNTDGQDAFYLANSQQTAEHEVHFDYDQKELFRVETGSIFAFNALQFANDFSLSHPLTGAKNEGSYEFCQSIAEHLTETHGLSGVLYPSRQMNLAGLTGQCIVLLPKPHQLLSGELRIFRE